MRGVTIFSSPAERGRWRGAYAVTEGASPPLHRAYGITSRMDRQAVTAATLSPPLRRGGES